MKKSMNTGLLVLILLLAAVIVGYLFLYNPPQNMINIYCVNDNCSPRSISRGAATLVKGCYLDQNDCLTAVTTTTTTVSSSTTSTTREILVGGNCSYDKFDGKCKITSITRTDASRQQAQQQGGYEGFEIKFRFVPSKPMNIDSSRYQSILSTYWDLRLANSWYPGPLFIQKYGIDFNVNFDCKVDVETQGSCTPTLFEFSTINTTDYFEMTK